MSQRDLLQRGLVAEVAGERGGACHRGVCCTGRLLQRWLVTEGLVKEGPVGKGLVTEGPNVSTTPITAMGRQQCLPLSII